MMRSKKSNALAREDGNRSDPVPSRLKEDEWRFIDPKKYKIDESEKAVLFRYELAREPGMKGSVLFSMMKRVFPDHFPNSPFLTIPVSTRKSLWKTHTESLVPHSDPLEATYGFKARFRYRLNNGDDLDDGRADDSERDTSSAAVSLDLDLEYSDKLLCVEFAKFLKKIRKFQPLHVGKNGVSLDVLLKRLAAKRLFEEHSSIDAVFQQLENNGYEDPYTGNLGSWYKARKAVERWKHVPPSISQTGRSGTG